MLTWALVDAFLHDTVVEGVDSDTSVSRHWMRTNPFHSKE